MYKNTPYVKEIRDGIVLNPITFHNPFINHFPSMKAIKQTLKREREWKLEHSHLVQIPTEIKVPVLYGQHASSSFQTKEHTFIKNIVKRIYCTPKPK